VGWLDGKRTLVIGAGSGIGRAVAEAFNAEGAALTLIERSAAKADALRAAFPHADVHTGDGGSADVVACAIDSTVRRLGGVDTLVNCVGVFDFYRGIATLTVEQLESAFDEIFSTNVRGLLVSVRVALDALRATRGSIVLTGSTSSFYAGRGGVLYVATKFAVRGAVLALAHELAPDIRVNGVAAGGTLDTELRGLEALGEVERVLETTPERREAMQARSPLDRALSPDDHAGAYVYLASDRASAVTGEFIHTDGGFRIR
jgi:NAD(P)-dependent dehydrogenase (short-subunit alcohol dehydrogenase family)